MTGAGMRGGSWLWGPRARLGLAVLLATVLLDQAHKWWMLSVYGIREGMRVAVTPFLDLVFVKNIGISYSLLQSGTLAGQALLASFAVAASLALWVWLTRPATTRIMAWSLALIIGGAIGNAIDRLAYGAVVDFALLHVAIGGKIYNWYVFNLADVAIVAGVAALLYDSFLGQTPAEVPQKGPDNRG